MNIQWAIPSYRRPKVCAEATVNTLITNGVNPKDITIYLSDPNEQDEYQKHLHNTGVTVKDGKPGVAHNRKHIQHSYPEGTQLVCCDDDLTGIMTKSTDGKKLQPLHITLPEFAEGAFARSKEAGAGIWGIYAAQNAMFMSHTETAGLRYIIASFFGTTTVDKDVARDNFLESSGEDFLTSIPTLRMHIPNRLAHSKNKILRRRRNRRRTQRKRNQKARRPHNSPTKNRANVPRPSHNIQQSQRSDQHTIQEAHSIQKPKTRKHLLGGKNSVR